MLSSSRDIKRLGSLSGAIEKGLYAGAKYFEIYEVDVIHPVNRSLLEELDKKLK
jgi:hypothetical protein